MTLCLAHAALAVGCMGGWSGATSPHPLALHDHAIQQHNAWVTRPMLARTGFAAGYDPYFMSGYAKSLFSSPSSTLYEVAALLTGGASPPVVYKIVVLLALASLPAWVALAGFLFRLGAGATAWGVGVFLLYVWTEGGGGGFPLNYALFGMSAFLMAVPLGLAIVGAAAGFLARGGFGRWLLAALLAALGLMVHVTSVLFLAPALVTAAFLTSGPSRTGRRLGGVLWFLPLTALALNAFWWLPASWLRTTRGAGGAFFSHPEPVVERLGRIATSEPPIQAVCLGLGLIGVAVLSRRDRVAAGALAGFALSGLVFGYLAGADRRFDFLQPGRQTYALYAAASVLAGVGISGLGTALRSAGSRRLMIAASLALLLIATRLFLPSVNQSIRYRLGLGGVPGAPRPFLSSEPPPGLEEIISAVRKLARPGQRIFYEEEGQAVPGEPDPFDGGRYSGLLPQLTGVEVIGGFYLYVGIDANFTQIGGGKFFGQDTWTQEGFRRYARLYRPSAIVCFSAKARAFCLANPDLIELVEQKGRLLIGRVVGFEGAAILGKAEVAASPGRLVVSGMAPDLDGLVVLRYHVVPGIRCRPSMPIVAFKMEGDPVPFLALKPGPGQAEATLDIGFPPGR